MDIRIGNRQRVSTVGTVEGISSAGIVRKSRIEREMEKIATEGEGMPSVLIGDIVEKLKIAIDPGVETRGCSDGGEQTAQIGLRVAHIRWVRCRTVEPIRCCERIPGIRILLTT
jgi:hypothetical protein